MKQGMNLVKHGGDVMPRFTVGARIRVADEKFTDRVGTIVEVLPAAQRLKNADHYRVEFSDGTQEEVGSPTFARGVRTDDSK
jgi:hypothetical protein